MVAEAPPQGSGIGVQGREQATGPRQRPRSVRVSLCLYVLVFVLAVVVAITHCHDLVRVDNTGSSDSCVEEKYKSG